MRPLALLGLAACLAGCDPGAAAAGAASRAQQPERFGFGRPASGAEIARVDIDVMPDGRGLPAGRGTVPEGERLYAERCASCHGAEGEGTRLGGPLVGRTPGDAFDFAASLEKEGDKTIGSYWPYATTLFDYVRRAMPFDRPGSLSDAEVYALTAYLLHRNGIVPADAVMDAATLPRVRMPARDRFVPDDREKSDRVR